MTPIEVLEEFRERYHREGNRRQERIFDKAIAVLELANFDDT